MKRERKTLFARALAAVLGLTLLAATAARAADFNSVQVWAESPSREAEMAVWPQAAAARRKHGDALALCRIRDDGRLTDCRVAVERPKGEGFGAALLSLIPSYRMAPEGRGDGVDPREAVITATWPVPDQPVEWRWAPKKGDFEIRYPPAALHTGQLGRTVMNCLLGAQGGLYDCQIVVESPPGVGWGWSTWRFAPFLRFKPVLFEGKRGQSSITIPFHFQPIEGP